MSGRLNGKVAIITGAGSRGPGIGNGKATAILFAREGAKVFCVDQVKDRAEETVAAIRAEGGEAVAHAADVTRPAECAAVVKAAVDRSGGVDILHNNVCIESRKGVLDTTEEGWGRVGGMVGGRVASARRGGLGGRTDSRRGRGAGRAESRGNAWRRGSVRRLAVCSIAI